MGGYAKGSEKSASLVAGVSDNKSAFAGPTASVCGSIGVVGGCKGANDAGTTSSVSLTPPALGGRGASGHVELTVTGITQPSMNLLAALQGACAAQRSTNFLCAAVP